MDKLTSPGKPFEISKWAVQQAWEKVKASGGAPGVDGVTIGQVETDRENVLYRVWNRLASGSYFPPAVRAVEIPKPHGAGVRMLGVPTVADRVAQTVVAEELERVVEPLFHDDSYGFRPNRSAHDAVGTCRARCFDYDWVLDLDIQKFFDEVDHELVLQAVAEHTDKRWVMLYVQRWLTAPVQTPEGELRYPERGTPQGSAISPVLANLFLHYAFDTWMARHFPGVPFERYVDDAVIHCTSYEQAHEVLVALEQRMNEVGLRLHPGKTRIVYCQDSNRRGQHAHTSFDFLGFTFAQRRVKSKKGRVFSAFTPAVSKKAQKKMSQQVRSWALHRRTNLTFGELARMINPIVRGWINYYGAFYPSALFPLLGRINAYLMRWIRKKYRRYRPRKAAQRKWDDITGCYPRYFAHWRWVATVPAVW